MDSKTKEILQKFSAQKVDLARSTQIINSANKLMNKSESIQDKSDSKLKLFEKTFDDLVLQGRELKGSIGDMSDMQFDIKQEMKELEDILKSLGASTSASKEYGLLQNAFKGLDDLKSLGTKINNDYNKYY
jgi:hypothetical protein